MSERKRLIAEETLILDVGEALAEVIEVRRVPYGQIAQDLGVRESRIRKFMAGDRTDLREAARIAYALGGRLEVRFEYGTERPSGSSES